MIKLTATLEVWSEISVTEAERRIADSIGINRLKVTVTDVTTDTMALRNGLGYVGEHQTKWTFEAQVAV